MESRVLTRHSKVTSGPGVETNSPAPAAEAKRKPRVCVVILQYNAVHLTLDLLESVVQYERPQEHRYLLLDNGSEDPRGDEIRRRFPFVEMVLFGQNHGFGKAHNLALPMIEEDWIFLINNDCVLLNDAITRTLGRAVALGVDYATCELFNVDGTHQINFSTKPSPLRWILLGLTGFNRVVLGPIRCWLPSPRVGYINGACLLIRRTSIPHPSLFDERYFMYTEDLDLMVRFARTGAVGRRLRGGRVIHVGGASARPEEVSGKLQPKSIATAVECLMRYYPAWQVELWQHLRGFLSGVLR